MHYEIKLSNKDDFCLVACGPEATLKSVLLVAHLNLSNNRSIKSSIYNRIIYNGGLNSAKIFDMREIARPEIKLPVVGETLIMEITEVADVPSNI